MSSSPGGRRDDLPRLYPVYPPNNSTENTNLDIVAVHGLETWSPRTWVGQKGYGTPNAGKEVNWLSDPDMLHENIPCAKIWVYDYNSNYSRDASETRLKDVGGFFLKSLMAEEIGKRPLVFIGSCFGGIVIVQALVEAYHDKENTYLSFLQSILGVVFLGTPLRIHWTRPAERENFVHGILGETTSSQTILNEIENLSPTHEYLVDEFEDMARHLNYEIRCFFETMKTKVIRSVFRSGPLSHLNIPGSNDGLIVTRSSATLHGYPKIAMDAPHVMMNKFTGPDELRFKVLVQEIKTIAEVTRRHQFDEQEAKILSSLFSDYEAGKDTNPDQVPGTCLWFTDHPNFISWRDETSETEAKLLWVTADPGCGKSVLAKTLIDKSLLSTEIIHLTTCYFFFKKEDASRNRGIHALRSILHQLFMQRPELIEFAKSDYKTKGETLFSSLTSLWGILQSCATSLKIGKIICVIDALDECLESDRYLLIKLLRELDAPQRRTKKSLKVVVTCRPYHDIVGAFNDSNYGNRSIRLRGEKETEKIREDIDTVIEHEIPRIASCQNFQLDLEAQDSLIKHLKDMKHHSYLWLPLILDELWKMPEYSTPELRDLLRCIPVDTVSVTSVDDDYSQTIPDAESDTVSAELSSTSSSEESRTTASSFSTAIVPINKEDSERSFPSTFYEYTIPAIQDSLDQDSDIQSVLSINEDISSMAGSDSNLGAFHEAAANYLVKNFTDDGEILALYQEAMQKLDEARFVRNHRRLLKVYFLDLQSEEQSPSQNLAIRFLRRRSERTLISTKIRRILMPSDNTVREKINVLLDKEKDTLLLLNRHLEQADSTVCSPGNIEASSIQGVESDNLDTASETTEDSDDEIGNDNHEGVDEADDFVKLKSAADFLITGRPFDCYKANLRKFLNPGSKLDSVELPGAISFHSVEKLQRGIASLVVVILLLVVMLDATRIRLWYYLWNSNSFLYGNVAGPPNAIFGTQQEDIPSSGCNENISSTYSIFRFIKFSVYAFCNIRLIFLSSELPPHTTRIRWTCNCGHQSYDDFISERRVVETIANRLFRSGIKVQIVSRRQSGIVTLSLLLRNICCKRRPGAYRKPSQPSQYVSGDLQAIWGPGAIEHNVRQELLDNRQDNADTELQSLSREPAQERQRRGQDDVRYLHLCLNMGFNPPCMQHFTIDLKSPLTEIVNCDQQLFREIKKRHLEARRRRISVFIKLEGIYFVEYRLFPRTLVGGLKENKVPTDKSEYDFKEIRDLKDGDSPIPPNLMLHFYNEPENMIDDKLCLDAFPKRKLEPLYWRRGHSNVGYGIYLKEELNEMLFALIRCSIACSVGLVGWVVFLVRHDLEKNYPWAAVLWISGIGVFATEVLKEWLKARFESVTKTKSNTE
ncbi:hypothetical protein BP6252_13118 [Coleophoma cylindrospora]|uniref:Nephrocystin 3-like N-terminal domain-containing protein n=1 Tax=Coleophoma cylindrospora TaxID=1849047 RepID=A0A3D8Q9W6_9HELO|nr:hypothetical protein BP6252_13118 [Coleophoma cylindrospora]